MIAYEVKVIAILNAKGVAYMCILWGISKIHAINRLNNSALEAKGILHIDFDANKIPIKVNKEGAFGGTYFRDIYSVLMESGTKCHEKNLISWNMLIRSIIAQIIMMLVLLHIVLHMKHP